MLDCIYRHSITGKTRSNFPVVSCSSPCHQLHKTPHYCAPSVGLRSLPLRYWPGAEPGAGRTGANALKPPRELRAKHIIKSGSPETWAWRELFSRTINIKRGHKGREISIWIILLHVDSNRSTNEQQVQEILKFSITSLYFFMSSCNILVVNAGIFEYSAIHFFTIKQSFFFKYTVYLMRLQLPGFYAQLCCPICHWARQEVRLSCSNKMPLFPPCLILTLDRLGTKWDVAYCDHQKSLSPRTC